ncbi:Gfo/Idh/MocA family protein [Confluentibacter flavum]|uniref:Gfo/Idh/MocA family oxidoreductase n=1 Tax=Confluentibacter flavum TaxID=1909700 RepID=A0A2N3HK67_9FLAO|nr:Gfo/Idh/MocA family oxidoreductase [Confluentibacter flavum]PKQ45331.1 gfo/Idh/MocA family oxidoreductase [Confluentibacter flavum]
MKRKEFLTKSALLSVSVISATSVFGVISNTTLNKTIKIGVIGTGDRGSGLISILNDIDGIDVFAVCDILDFRLKNGLSKTNNRAKSYINYKDLLDDKEIDAVLIATPFNTHAQIAIDAVDAGKHVYCEKTMAKGLKGIDALVSKVSNSNLIFQTGHQYHSSKLYKHIVDLIKSGEIGDIASFECQWNRNGNWRRPVSDPALERVINWRMYKEYSGGLVAELCSHQIDFVSWVLGENPKKIMGTGGIDFWKDGRETYDNIYLLYEYPSGVKATFKCLTSNSLNDYQIKVQGSMGTIIIGTEEAWVYYEEKGKKEFNDIDGVSGATSQNYSNANGKLINVSHLDPSKQALIDFRDAIINNDQPISNLYTGAHTAIAVQMSLDAMYNNTIEYWKEDYNF